MIDGKRLRQLREAHGYSRRELAEKISVADSQIVRYEAGENDATGEMLARIATFFGVSTDYLLGLSDAPTPVPTGDLAPDEVALIVARRRRDYPTAIRLLVPEESP